MSAFMSWYDVLQVPRDARAEDIKAAYHALLLRLHPDKRGALSGDTQQQQQQQQQQGQLDKQQFHLVQLAWKVGSMSFTSPVAASCDAPNSWARGAKGIKREVLCLCARGARLSWKKAFGVALSKAFTPALQTWSKCHWRCCCASPSSMHVMRRS